jgi:acetyl esterase/lipase
MRPWVFAASCGWLFAGSVLHAQAPAPRQIRVERDLSFLTAERLERADLYHPHPGPERSRVPAVLVLHGGGFYGGSRAGDREEEICRFLAEAGYLAMSADYALSDRGQPVWPRNLWDCKWAVHWLRQNADRLHVDGGRIAVLGASAGGHLAAMVALTGTADGLQPPELPGADFSVSACVNLYGPMDLTGLSRLSMLGPTRAEAPELYQQASPVHFASADDPPVLTLHGTADVTVDPEHARGLDIALRRAGAVSELELLEGMPHGFSLGASGPGTRVLEFLGRVFAK